MSLILKKFFLESVKAWSIAQQWLVEMPANAVEGSTARQDNILNQKRSMNTATLRQELQNRLGANSLFDLVVFGRMAADTTVEFAVCEMPPSSATLVLFLTPGPIALTEVSDCWEVTSLSLVATTSSWIFSGIHHCQLLSPAMAISRHNTSHSRSWRPLF